MHAADTIIRKTSCDSFLETSLDQFLRTSAIEGLIITGCATDYCVDTTVRSALARGWPTTVYGRDKPILAALNRTEGDQAVAAAGTR